MDGLFSLVAECVTRFDGTVDKFTGDGAMALFGAPVAHEDHAVRACYTALFLGDRLERTPATVRRDHGFGLSVRIGLNSGEVVVGGIGADRGRRTRRSGTPWASRRGWRRWRSPAALPDEEHRGAGRRLLRARRRGRAPRQGRPGPVHAFALVGVGAARTRLDVSAGRGLSRFVGRTAELEALEAAYEPLRSGGQVVGVVADPGIGKSRLCREFTERCRAAASRSRRAAASRTAGASRCCRWSRCCAATSGSARTTTAASRARRSPAGCC